MSIRKIEITAAFNTARGFMVVKTPKPLMASTTISFTLPEPWETERRTPGNLMEEANDWANRLNDGAIMLDEAGWQPDGFGVWRRTAYYEKA